MIKVENNNTYNIGDTVWWIDAWGNLRWGVIYEIQTKKKRETEPVTFALIHEEGKEGLQTGAEIGKCWPTKEECWKAEMRRSNAQKAEYKASIKDVDGLVRFLFDHDVSSGDRDYDAEAAAKERAKELLGLELD